MKIHKQDGQSTIEFIVTLMFALGVIFLFVNISINYSAGYLVHYATFMASRTYLTVDSNGNQPGASENIAAQAAFETFRRFQMSAVGVPTTGVMPPGGSGNGFYINPFSSVSNSQQALFVGAYARYEKPLSFFKVLAGDTPVTFVSESYLGKEPVRADCWQRTCQAIMLGVKGTPDVCSPSNSNDFTVFDNGC
jgi:hypothetical protein